MAIFSTTAWSGPNPPIHIGLPRRQLGAVR